MIQSYACAAVTINSVVRSTTAPEDVLVHMMIDTEDGRWETAEQRSSDRLV